MKHTDNFVERCVKAHMAAFEVWPHGLIKETWTDEGGNLCIRYQDGMYWRYKEEDGHIIWW